MKSLVGQQVGFKLKRKRFVKSAISNHGFQLVSMKIISHLVLYCYVLLTVFIVCLGIIKDILFIVVSCVSLFSLFPFSGTCNFLLLKNILTFYLAKPEAEIY